MLKALGLGRGITIKIIPKIKRMPRERITTLTLTKQRKPPVSNIIIIQNPKRTFHDQYRTDSETIKEDARKQYKTNPEPKSRAARKQYSPHPEPKKRAARKQYKTNPEPKKRAARKQYNNHPGRNKAAARVRWALNRDSVCVQKRAKYAL